MTKSSPKLAMMMIIMATIIFQINSQIIPWPEPTPPLTQTQSEENCTVQYPRILFTPQTFTINFQSTSYRYLILFNTRSICRRSFVVIRYNETSPQHREREKKFFCEDNPVKFVMNGSYKGEEKAEKGQENNFVHRCEVNWKGSGIESFSYGVYGFGKGSYDHYSYLLEQEREDQDHVKRLSSFSSSIQSRNSKFYKVNIPRENSQINLLITADWGPISKKNYPPIYPAITNLISDSKHEEQKRIIHGLFLLGDIAYSLTINYHKFMQEFSQISPYLPLIILPGNRDNHTVRNYELFSKSFEVFGVGQASRVQAWDIHGLRIVGFNPYPEIKNFSTQEKSQLMREAIFAQIQRKRDDRGDTDMEIIKPFIILASHYPLVCSQEIVYCKKTLQVLKDDLFDKISNMSKVDLYLGAHMHQYERICPYVNAEFNCKLATDDDHVDRGMMPSIVEGVAGNDEGVAEEDFASKQYSVRHGWNHTGFGLFSYHEGLRRSDGKGVFRHFQMVRKGDEIKTELYDELTIQNPQE